jgi:hypothetical protein
LLSIVRVEKRGKNAFGVVPVCGLFRKRDAFQGEMRARNCTATLCGAKKQDK